MLRNFLKLQEIGPYIHTCDAFKGIVQRILRGANNKLK
jgi:hypothetical protein